MDFDLKLSTQHIYIIHEALSAYLSKLENDINNAIMTKDLINKQIDEF